MAIFKIVSVEAHSVEDNWNEGEVGTWKPLHDYDIILGNGFVSLNVIFTHINILFNTDFSPETSSYSDGNKLFLNCYQTKKYKTPTPEDMEDFKNNKINLLSIYLTLKIEKVSDCLVDDFENIGIESYD